MKSDAFHSIAHGVTSIAVTFYPAYAFYGASLWQMTGIYVAYLVVTIVLGVAVMVMAGTNQTFGTAVIRLKNNPVATIIVQAITLVTTFAIFDAIMQSVIPQSLSIQNIIVFVPLVLATLFLKWVFAYFKADQTPA